MKILNSTNKNFNNSLNKLLLHRKKKVQSNSISVTSIVRDVKKNGDKALLKYEKRFNQNRTIVPTSNQINNSIKSLDQKVKNPMLKVFNNLVKFSNEHVGGIARANKILDSDALGKVVAMEFGDKRNVNLY